MDKIERMNLFRYTYSVKELLLLLLEGTRTGEGETRSSLCRGICPINCCWGRNIKLCNNNSYAVEYEHEDKRCLYEAVKEAGNFH